MPAADERDGDGQEADERGERRERRGEYDRRQ
jgi:hypothetical protein